MVILGRSGVPEIDEAQQLGDVYLQVRKLIRVLGQAHFLSAFWTSHGDAEDRPLLPDWV